MKRVQPHHKPHVFPSQKVGELLSKGSRLILPADLIPRAGRKLNPKPGCGLCIAVV